jgi:hypothetical protein
MLHTWQQCDHDTDRQRQITFNEYQHTFRNTEPPHYSETHGIQSAIVTPIANSGWGGEGVASNVAPGVVMMKAGSRQALDRIRQGA